MSRLGRFALINTAGNAFVPLSGAVTAPLLASSLGAVGRGEVAAATTPLLLGLTIAGLGLPEAATYFVSKDKLTRRGLVVLWMGIAVGSSIGMLGIWMFRDVLSDGNSDLAWTILICSMLLPACLSCGLLRGISAGRHLWVLVNLERFLTALVRLIAIVALIAADSFTVLTASLAIAGSQVAGGAVYLYLLFAPSSRSNVIGRPAGARRIYRYSSGAWFGSLAGVMLLRFDQLMMLPLSDSYQLGIYAVAVNVAELMLVGSNAIRDVMFSAESAKPDPARMLMASRIAFSGTLLLSLVSFGLCLLLLPSLFGLEFAFSTVLLGIMAVGFSIGAPGSIAGAGLASRGAPYLRSLSLTFAACVNVALVLFLVPILGALGAAIATAISAALGGIMNQVFYSRKFGVSGLATYRVTRADVLAITNLIRKSEGRRERQQQLSK